MGNLGYGIDTSSLYSVAKQIKEIKSLGVDIGIVIGAGNLFRGIKVASQGGMDKHPVWYYNIVAHPEIVVTVGGSSRRMIARQVSERSTPVNPL